MRIPESSCSKLCWLMASSQAASAVAQAHGVADWYLQHQAERPVVVRLTLSGFYELPDAAPAAK